MKYLLSVLLMTMMMNDARSLNNEDYVNDMEVLTSVDMVMDALTVDIGKWWITNATQVREIGDTLKVNYKGTSKTFVLSELEPGKKVVWDCIDVFLNVPSLNDKNEWIGTKVIWTINETSSGVKLNRVHQGLNPKMECYTICQPTWDFFFKESLNNYLAAGVGDPLVE